MKKIVRTPEGHVINFSVSLSDGSQPGETDILNLQQRLIEAILAKAEPSEEDTSRKWPCVA